MITHDMIGSVYPITSEDMSPTEDITATVCRTKVQRYRSATDERSKLILNRREEGPGDEVRILH